MKLKTTLVLFIVVAALAAFIKYYESKRPGTDEAARQAGNVLNFDRDTLDGIIIQNGEDKTELRRSDSKWRVESPIKDQADNAAVSTLISDLEIWRKDDTIPAKGNQCDQGQAGRVRTEQTETAAQTSRPGNAAGSLHRQRRGARRQNVCSLRKFEGYIHCREFRSQ